MKLVGGAFLGLLLIIVANAANASLFDADFEPCYKRVVFPQIKLEREKLLEGDGNFILLKPHVDNSVYFDLNCARRVYAIEVLKRDNAATELVQKALDVLAYQATFSPEAAVVLIEFLKSNDNQELRASAAKALYFLNDIFPNIAVQAEFFQKPYFLDFFREVTFYEKNKDVASWVAQIAQKVAGYFYRGDRYCYRKQFSSRIRQHGEDLAKVLAPIIFSALKARTIDDNDDNVDVRNELIVAVNNFGYSRFIKYDSSTLNKLVAYYESEKDPHFKKWILNMVHFSDVLTGKRQVRKSLPDYDSYCPDSALHPTRP